MVVNSLSSSQNQFISIISPLSGSGIVAQAAERVIINPLADITEKYLNNDQETYGVYIKNLNTGESYGYNQNLKFETASLYKLWIMGTFFERVSKGKIQNTLANQQAIEKMITVSDNDAADMLIGELGKEQIQNFVQEHGFYNSSFEGTPVSTPAEIGLFFEKLYRGEIIDSTNSLSMMSVLERQKINDRIPKYIPKSVLIAHKTGELDSYKNDAGIVFSKKGDYIIVVMSKTNNPDIAAEKIAKYSEAVFSYFSSL